VVYIIQVSSLVTRSSSRDETANVNTNWNYSVIN